MIENVTVGDWVQFIAEGKLTQMRVVGIEDNERFIQTEETDTYYNKEIYEPIPLTPEILEKNGFKLNKMESELHKVCGVKLLDYDFPTVLGSGFLNHFLIKYHTEKAVAYLTDHCFILIKYVHEFQHLLRLMERKAPEVKEIADNFIV